MTIQHKGGARVPGPLGISPGGIGGRIPGPLGFRHVVVAAAGPTAKVLKTLKMPAPAAGSSVSTVHEVASPLFSSTPATAEVRQGALATCPIGSILAALAHTASGRKRIQGMVAEHKGVVETDLADVADKLDSPPKGNKIISNRYFTVTLGATTIEVSDVFYTDDGDRGSWSLIYMGSSRGGPPTTLWPSVIEKAYAVTLRSYEELDDDTKHPANEFWEVLVGSKPGGFPVDDKTALEKIRDAAKAAPKVPTIGASRDDATKVLGHHGFAVLGIEGSTIELYNPHGRTEKISLTDFRSNFKAILYGNP